MVPESLLTIAYDLTAAKVRLVLRLLSGRSPRVIATTLGVTYETARSTLKAAFHKTSTHRQSEFVAMLARADLSFEGTAEEARTRRSRESRDHPQLGAAAT